MKSESGFSLAIANQPFWDESVRIVLSALKYLIITKFMHSSPACVHCKFWRSDHLQVYASPKVTSMEELPIRAVHFGDTGTPLDSKEGR